MRTAALLRFIHVVGVLRRHQVDKTLGLGYGRYAFAFLRGINPLLWRNPHKGLARGALLRLALESLGPIYIKFGQVLSTRQDLLPEDIAEELALLQDKVAPFPGNEAEAIVVEALGVPIAQSFQHFERACLASASVAQVHAAQLLSGESVVVKVIRPGIAKQIKRDLDLLHFMAGVFLRMAKDAERYRPHALIDAFAEHLSLELDLVHEGANASQLARNFKNSPLLHVPQVYWSHSRRNILVMERIHGIKISDIKGMQDKGVDFKVLAENGVTIFFTQLLRDNFFHADMHPGNIFVDCSTPARPRYAAVDFGIMGSLSKDDQRYIAENLLAFFEQDYQRVAELHIRSGWIPADTSVNAFAGSIRAVCEPIFEKPFSEISYAQLLGRLLGIAEQYAMPIQPQLMLLQKTLLNIEGLGRMLYPELDLWSTAKPMLAQWMKEQRSPRRFIKQASRQVPYWRDQLIAMPDLLQRLLEERTKSNQLQAQPASSYSRLMMAASAGVVLGAVGVWTWPWWQHQHLWHRSDWGAMALVALVCYGFGLCAANRRKRLCGNR